MNLYAEANSINRTEGYRIGDSDIYETFTPNRGELYRAMRREYGRCVGTCYVGDGEPVGWIFVQRAQYEDTGETYLRETWVTVHAEPPTKTIEYHYA